MMQKKSLLDLTHFASQFLQEGRVKRNEGRKESTGAADKENSEDSEFISQSQAANLQLPGRVSRVRFTKKIQIQ